MILVVVTNKTAVIGDNMVDNKPQMFKIDKEDFETLYKAADTVLETRSFDVPTQESVAAKALQDRLDLAIEDEESFILFSENEVQCLSSVLG